MRSLNVPKCCCVRIVVGARIITCLLSWTALKAARSATSVLPNPTSPQIRMSIGCGDSMPSLTRSIASSWSRVSWYGKAPSNCICISLSGLNLKPIARRARGVEVDQLAGELVRGLARAGLEVLPRLAAELAEVDAVGAGRAEVAADLVQLIGREEDLVVAAVEQRQVVAGDAGDGLGVEAVKARDAVVFVDDDVADGEVGEVRDPAARARLGRGAAAGRPHQQPVGDDREFQRRRDEAFAQRLLREEDTGPLAAPRRTRRASRLDAREVVLRALAL